MKRLINAIKKSIKPIYMFSFGIIGATYLLTKKENNDIVIVLTPLIGDSVYGMSCMDAIVKTYPDYNILVIGNERYESFLSEYNGINKMLYLNAKSKRYYLIRCFLRSEILSQYCLNRGIVNANPWLYRKMRESENSDAFIQLRTNIFHIPVDSAISYPKVQQQSIEAITNFGEIKEKIVIVNPYSNSMNAASRARFQQIANYLDEQGYVIFTNVVDNQMALENTIPLRCSLEELYSICKSIHAFVSVRSGIVDFLVGTDVNLFILYDGAQYNIFRMYHVSSWKRTGVVKEIYINQGQEYPLLIEDFRQFMLEIEKS